MSSPKKVYLESLVSIPIDGLIDDIHNSLCDSPNNIVKFSLELLESICYNSNIDKSLLKKFRRTLDEIERLN